MVVQACLRRLKQEARLGYIVRDCLPYFVYSLISVHLGLL
jgi:hypothetical protein